MKTQHPAHGHWFCFFLYLTWLPLSWRQDAIFVSAVTKWNEALFHHAKVAAQAAQAQAQTAPRHMMPPMVVLSTALLGNGSNMTEALSPHRCVALLCRYAFDPVSHDGGCYRSPGPEVNRKSCIPTSMTRGEGRSSLVQGGFQSVRQIGALCKLRELVYIFCPAQ